MHLEGHEFKKNHLDGILSYVGFFSQKFNQNINQVTNPGNPDCSRPAPSHAVPMSHMWVAI